MQSLAELARAALRMLSSGTEPPWLPLHLNAGYEAAFACSLLATHAAELSAATSFKVAASCSLVFGPGAALLERQLQLHGAMAGGATTPAQLQEGCDVQLTAVAWALQMLHPSPRLKAAAAFAGSAGKPAALLPWLRTVSRALVAAGAAFRPDCKPGEFGLRCALCTAPCVPWQPPGQRHPPGSLLRALQASGRPSAFLTCP